jgi:hypothetical protein
MMDTNGQNRAERMTCNGRHSGLEDVGGLVGWCTMRKSQVLWKPGRE